MAPRYVKKILEFSQREKSAEKYFMESTSHSAVQAQRPLDLFNPINTQTMPYR
jgi:hypothetical protein